MRPTEERPLSVPAERLRWLLTASALAGAMLVSPVTPAQEGSGQQAGEEVRADQPPTGEQGGELPDIDHILREDEAIWSGSGYTYEPGDRRDPFRSLLEAREQLERTGPRPEGVPGLLIDEITVTGIFQTRRGRSAQVQATNQNKAFLIREGDQLFDGDVVSIGRNEVVFKQIVQDPTALKPFHEVVKKLNP